MQFLETSSLKAFDSCSPRTSKILCGAGQSATALPSQTHDEIFLLHITTMQPKEKNPRNHLDSFK